MGLDFWKKRWKNFWKRWDAKLKKENMVELVYKKMKIRYPTHFMTLGKLAHGFLLICLISVVLLGLVTYFWALIISYHFQKYYSSRWLGPNNPATTYTITIPLKQIGKNNALISQTLLLLGLISEINMSCRETLGLS